MNKGYKERQHYEDKNKEVKTPVKDSGREKSKSEKYADRIPTPQGTNK